MNDSDDLKDILGRGADSLPPLEPAKVIAGAHRRRRVRGLVTAGVACGAVVAVVAGGVVVAANGPSGREQPGPPVVGSPVTPSPPTRPPTVPPTSTRTPKGPAVSVAACLRPLTESGRPGPTAKSRTRLRLDEATGTTMIVADRTTWLGCDRSHDDEDRYSLIEPGRMTPPSTAKVDPFRVSNRSISIGSSRYERFWAAGMLPAGVRTIRYTFWDGASRDAKVADGFWVMQYQRSQPAAAGQDITKLARIKVELIAAGERVVRTFRLSWLTDTCAQINHGC